MIFTNEILPRGLGNKSGGEFMGESRVFKQVVAVIQQTGVVQGIRSVWLLPETVRRTAGLRVCAFLCLIHHS